MVHRCPRCGNDMRINIGDEYRYKDHVGKVTDVSRLINENGDAVIMVCVHLPTMPRGQQWLTTHGPESDYTEEYIQ